QRGIGMLGIAGMRNAHAWANIHVANIHIGLPQHSSDAPDHAGLIVVAAEENIAVWHNLSPVAPDAHHARDTMHNCPAEYIDMLIAGAGFTRERRCVAIAIE